jgi:amidophosphoribosyltransferase
MRKIVRMVRGMGAKSVHVRIACPPTISPCFYGVDTPTKAELIAANQSTEEVCLFIGADSLGYLSLSGLKAACGKTRSYCASCFTGKYQTPVEHLINIL